MGDLTTVSTRNVDKSADYQELSRYVKGKDRVLTSILFIPIYSRPNFEEATEDAVKKIPNGEFLRNATIKSRYRWYLLWTTEEIIITGDVWGEDSPTTLTVGSTVTFTSRRKVYEGEILKIEGSRATVKYMKDGKEKVKEVDLSELFLK